MDSTCLTSIEGELKLFGTFAVALDEETGNRSEQEYAVNGILR